MLKKNVGHSPSKLDIPFSFLYDDNLYNPWKYKKISGFIMSAGSIEKDQWYALC